MGFRDDREALEAKLRAVEQELATTRTELDTANARVREVEGEAERLRAVVQARGDRATRMSSWTNGLVMGLVLGAGAALFVLSLAFGS